MTPKKNLLATGSCAIISLLFLFIPSYYASKAQAIIHIQPRRKASLQYGVTGDTFACNIPRPQSAYPSNTRPVSRPTNQSNSSYGIGLSSDRVGHTNTCWEIYITSRYQEWLFIVASATTFVVALLQMLGASGNIIIRSFILLAIFRTIAAISYALTLLFFFQKSQLRTKQFGVCWFEMVQAYRGSKVCIPWAILALPAIALCWCGAFKLDVRIAFNQILVGRGIIFFIVVIFCLSWEVGGMDVPSGISPNSLIGLLLRVAMTLTSLIDVACIFWVIKVLQEMAQKS